MKPFDDPKVLRLIDLALEEDIGGGDITAEACVPEGEACRAEIVVKEKGLVAGLPLAALIFRRISPELSCTSAMEDGSAVSPGDRVALIEGPARPLLAGERTVLNFLCRLSGIATFTRAFVEAAPRTDVYDTRKTTPGYRLLEKYAVQVGGGKNHRMGLHDQVLIKENHLRAAGGLSLGKVLSRCRTAAPPGVLVEIEVETLEEFETALAGGADIIMLDEFSEEDTARAVTLRGEKPVILELSGGVTLSSIGSKAVLGADRISSGALTHSAPPLDMALYVI